jgi:hypothetical protein
VMTYGKATRFFHRFSQSEMKFLVVATEVCGTQTR